MFTLPEVRGPYAVGATTFAVPLVAKEDSTEITIGHAKAKLPDSRDTVPALRLQEVAFTAYYPADMNVDGQAPGQPRKGLSWIVRPVRESLRGYAHFGAVPFWTVYWLLRGVTAWLKIPVYPNARLLQPNCRADSAADAPDEPWPLVIFSHGLCGTRTSYSHFCRTLASQGKVVLAIEHRDGTAPFVTTRSSAPGLQDEPGSGLYYLKPEDVVWEGGSKSGPFALRVDQLHYRRLETYICFIHFKNLVHPTAETQPIQPPLGEIHTIDGPWNFDLGSRPVDAAFWRSWTTDKLGSKVQCNENVALAGHSFGGATVLSILSQPPPELADRRFSQIPFTHAIALDPWLEPLPSPGPTPFIAQSMSSEGTRSPKLLVMNSEGFTLWDNHFERLKGIVRTWWGRPTDLLADDHEKQAHLLTLLRAEHAAFSDFGVLIPFGRAAKAGRKFLDIICDLSVAFLDNRIGEALVRQSRKAEQLEWVEESKGGKKRQYVGDAGDIIVH